ncbi:MAG: DsrE/DsrF/DrsH-like family protein [Myxococcota bacterium]
MSISHGSTPPADEVSRRLADLESDLARLRDELSRTRTELAETREQVATLDRSFEGMELRLQGDRATLVVFSGEFDRLFSAFVIATGAIAMGIEVSMYFTFWGLTALKKQTTYKGKAIEEKMIARMLPPASEAAPTSRMNFLGAGTRFFQRQMALKQVETLPDMIALAQELGVKLIACQMAMDVMGIREEELLDDIEYGGVATYLGDAIDSKITLMI